jgi:hypothetical protein
MQSWDIKYVGNADDLLYDHLSSYPKDEDKYARYTSIVQSSGMGKSRAIDELSKKHLVVPLNLREDSKGEFCKNCAVLQYLTVALGFPPPDENVRNWLLGGKTKMEAFTRAGAFLCALFDILLRYLQQIDAKIADISPLSNGGPPKSLEAKLRLVMTAGQTFSRQGRPRRQFYEEVLDLADEVCPLCFIFRLISMYHFYQIWLPPPPSTPPRKPMPSSPGLSFGTVKDAEGNTIKHDLKEAIGKLMEYLIKDFDVLKDYQPALIISFDEAHPLATIEKDVIDGVWSRFSELRRALRIIHSHPCFSVFLSTTGKINQFMPPPMNDSSDRMQRGLLGLMSPFCELGFDQLAEKAISGQTTLDEVSSLKFMTSLSRPL